MRVKRASLKLPQIKVIPIKDTQTNRRYELYVKLPNGYASEEKGRKYPVIYYTDALWHVEMLSGCTEYILENAILIGISWEKNPKSELGQIKNLVSLLRGS